MRTLLLIIVFLSAKTLPNSVEEYGMTLADTPIHVELQTNGAWRAENGFGAELGLYQVEGNMLHVITGTHTNTVDMNGLLVIPPGIDWDAIQQIELAKTEFGSPIQIDRQTDYIGLYQTDGYLGTNFVVSWTN